MTFRSVLGIMPPRRLGMRILVFLLAAGVFSAWGYGDLEDRVEDMEDLTEDLEDRVEDLERDRDWEGLERERETYL